MNCTIARYGELSLKGKNRASFEQALVRNIRALTDNKIFKLRGRIIIEGACELGSVFGISSYSPAIMTKSDDAAIKEAIDSILKGRDFSSFRVSCRRCNKEGNSLDMNRKFGAYVSEKYGWKVALQNPDVNIGIEMIGDDAFVFTEKIAGAGGLPVGVSGKVIIASGVKAEITAKMMMKRGCSVIMAGTDTLEELEKLAEKARAKAIVLNTCSLDKQRKGRALLLRPLIGKCT